MVDTQSWFQCVIKQMAEKEAGTKPCTGEQGATIVEYVGVLAIAAVIASAVILYLSTEGGATIGKAVANMIDEVIASFAGIP